MSKDLKGEIALSPEVSINVELTAQHLIDMQVSHTEENLIEAEEKLIAEVDVTAKKIAKANDRRRAILDKLAVAHRSEIASIVKPVLKKLGAKNIKVSDSWSEHKTEHRIEASVSIGPESRRENKVSGTLSFTKLITIPKTVGKIDKEIAAWEKESREIHSKLHKIKMGLSNIPRIERKARAALAQKTLESTPAGKRLATSLSSQPLLAPPT
jgi:hypothetical protein